MKLKNNWAFSLLDFLIYSTVLWSFGQDKICAFEQVIEERTIERVELEKIGYSAKQTNKKQNPSSLKSVGYFDNDQKEDTLYYYLDKSEGEPIFRCKMLFGDGKTKMFDISSGSGTIKLSNCRVGCIEKSEITTGMFKSEEIEKYQFEEDLNNWFIYQSIYKSNGKVAVDENFEEQWSIDDEMVK